MALTRLALLASATVVALTLGCATRNDPAAPDLTTTKPERLALGASASAATIAAWDVDINGRGDGLPPGRGTAADGARLYVARCGSCHGVAGEGTATASQLVRPTSNGVRPRRNVATHWPYAPPLFDYIRRTMPPDRPGSLADADVYALVAHLLAENGITPRGLVLDAGSLARVAMPARDRFVPDDRRGGPEVR